MANETLPGWPTDGWKNKWLRGKVWDLLYTLAYSKEEREKKQKEKNEKLLESFKEGYPFYFSDGKEFRYINEYIVRKWRRMEDILVFKDAEDMKSKMMDGTLSFNNSDWERPYKLRKIKIEGNSYNEDLNYILQHIWNNGLWMEFPVNHIHDAPKESIKILKKFLVKWWGAFWCYFNVWEDISQDDLKGLINRFTKKGKSWEIDDCVINANWKEYHSSWDYRYEFD